MKLTFSVDTAIVLPRTLPLNAGCIATEIIMKKLFPLILLAVSFVVGPAKASQVRVPVNTNTSSLALTLCATPSGLGTACDTDTKSLAGFITVALDNNGMPTQIALRNYDLRAQGNFNLNLSWVFGLARLDAVASNLQVYHARPGISNAPVPVVANACTFTNVPMRTSGNANYVINPLACSSIGGAFPCSSNINLAELGENSLTALTGTVQVVNGILSIDFDFIFEQPIDETNPTLGVFSGFGTVRGSTPVSLDLLPRGSDWKFLDDGSDQGMAWVQPSPAYDDSLWPLGLAQLGYGDGDEQTVVSYGPNAANKYITTYFRHAFYVPDALIYTNLALRVLYDDGVIVYLNGAEIHRANLPPDPFPSYLAVASSAVSTATENAFFAAPPIDPAFLVSGWNILAVGIHQSGPESSDISFDLEMLGNGSFPIAPPSVAIISPTNNTVFNGSVFSFQITATDSDGAITRVELFEGANKIGESTAVGPNYTISWNSSCPGPFTFTARATDNDGLVSVSLPVVVTRPPVTLVAPGSTWRFLDDGSNPSIAWRSNGFNEASWALGTGQFGFGDGDETTLLARTNLSGTTNLAFYFRQTFSLANPSSVGALTLRLLRDDGVIVYLNGAEVFRNNMPTGAVTSATTALTNATSLEESNFVFVVSVPANLLLAGNNVLAAQVHQVNLTSSDLSFDASLQATLTNRPPTSVALTSPANNSVFPTGASVPFTATAADPEGAIARVEYLANGVKIGEAANPPYSYLWNLAPAGTHFVTARAVDACGNAATSASIVVRIGAFTIIPPGGVWRYLDDGSNPGPTWTARSFNDSSWLTNPARFGYGNDGEVTTLARTNAGGTTNITFYFRRAFAVPDPSVVTGLVVRLVRDDGAVVYLNGQELFRENLPAGPIGPLTTALGAVSGADETTFFHRNTRSSALVPGANVLAVEIHQQAITSSDLGFDLELLGLVGSLQPRLYIENAGASHILRWPSAAVGFRLQSSPDLGVPAHWQDQAGAVSDDGAWKTLALPSAGPARFYRLAQ